MLTIPLLKTPSMQLLNSQALINHQQPLRFIRTETCPQKSLQEPYIDSLINAYCFKHLKNRCNANNHIPALIALKTPSYRALAIAKPTQLLNKILRDYNYYRSQAQQLLQLPINIDTRHLAVYLANHSPFVQNEAWFSHYDNLTQLPTDELMALLCATFIYQSCINKTSTEQEKMFFYQGLCSAYFNMQIAKAHELHPLHNFITPLIHAVSYLYIDRETHYLNELPSEELLLAEIDDTHHKLSYWIAKDWGLSDPISHTLKERFLNDLPTPEKEIMQKSEYAYLAIHLYQQRILNLRQTQSFLHSMGLLSYHFIDANRLTH